MKNMPTVTIITSLLIGAILVVVFAAQTSWQPIHNCQHPSSTARTEGCAVMEYGYPFRFISSNIDVGEQNVVFSTLSVNKKSLLFNWAVLSGAVAAGIVIAGSQIKAKKARRTKRK